MIRLHKPLLFFNIIIRKLLSHAGHIISEYSRLISKDLMPGIIDAKTRIEFYPGRSKSKMKQILCEKRNKMIAENLSRYFIKMTS